MLKPSARRRRPLETDATAAGQVGSPNSQTPERPAAAVVLEPSAILVPACRMCGMFDRMEAVFMEVPEELRDMPALGDIAAKREVHRAYCPRVIGGEA